MSNTVRQFDSRVESDTTTTQPAIEGSELSDLLQWLEGIDASVRDIQAASHAAQVAILRKLKRT